MVRYLLMLILIPACALAQPELIRRKISIVARDESLEAVLARISDAAGVPFSYSADAMPVDLKINFTAHDMPLGMVLDKLLQQYAITYKIAGKRIVFQKAVPPLTQTVRGTVVDQATHQPVPGANIVIADTYPMVGTTSDADGNFRISAVPVGRATLRITSVGYAPRVLPNLLLGTGKELVLEIGLAETLTAIDEVVVTASPVGELSDREMAAVSGHSFSVEQTRRYAGSLGDPARMAASYAGVTGASDESNALIVRGNSPRGVLWRVDGIEVPNPNHFATEGSSNGVISVLSPNVVNTTDFLTGAFSAQYGNALSAVLDMKLRTGNNARREHSLQAGLLGLEASTEGPFNKRRSSYLVNYRYSTLNVLDRIGVDLNDAGEFKDYQDASFKLDFPNVRKGKLSVFGLGGLSRSTQENVSVSDYAHANMGVGGVTYARRIGQTWLTTATSWSSTDISNNSRALGAANDTVAVQQHYGKSYARASLRLERKITDRFLIQAGMIYTRLFYNFYLRNLDPENQLYTEIINFREQGHTGITQAFASAEQHLSDALSLQYGLHYLSLALTGDRSLEPRVSMQWRVPGGNTLRIGYGKHSRIENLQYYLARDHQSGGNEVQVNKDLGFTRAHHYIAGYDHSLGKGHQFHLDVYYQRLYNAPVQTNTDAVYATLNEDSGFITDTLLNKGRGRNYGVEISFDRGLTRGFYYMVNGALFQSQFQSGHEPLRNTAYNGNYNVHLLGGKEFKMVNGRSALGLDIRVTSAGGRRYVPINLAKSVETGQTVYAWDSAFEPRLAAYFRTDVQIVYTTNHPGYTASWRLDIQNITNHVNAAYRYYDATAMQEKTRYQVGFLPVLGYRIEF